MSGAVRVHGLMELNRAFKKIDSEIGTVLRADLLHAAQPVAESAKGKIGRYQGASLGTIVPKVLSRSVFVYQNARKVTGLRGDYGALQMRKGLEPALEENTERIVASVNLAIDRLAAHAGF